MVERSLGEGSRARIVRHRVRTSATGYRRVEVTVAKGDAGLIRAVANTLRTGGRDAESMRNALKSMTSAEPVRTGAELVGFLRASPIVGEGLEFERDRSTGRVIDLE